MPPRSLPAWPRWALPLADTQVARLNCWEISVRLESMVSVLGVLVLGLSHVETGPDRWQGAVPVSTVTLQSVQEMRTVEGIERLLPVTYKADFLPTTGDPRQGVTLRGFRDISFRMESAPQAFSMTPTLNAIDVSRIEVVNCSRTLGMYGGSPLVGRYVNDALTGTLNVIAKHENFAKPVTANAADYAQPNGWNTLKYDYSLKDFGLRYEVSANYKYGDKEYSDLEVQGKIDIGNIWMPQYEPTKIEFAPDGMPDKALQQQLGGITVSPVTVGVNYQALFPPIGLGQINGGKDPKGYISDVERANGGKLVDSMQKLGYTLPQMLAALQTLAPEGTDMNRLNFPPMGTDPCDYDLDCPPGTIWYPSNPAYQAMMTGVRYQRLTFSDWVAGIGIRHQDSQAMRVLCMNMEKKEPAAGVKYFPYRSNDPVIPTLARLMDQANFRGPWDQARLWIYTDKATFEQVTERLVNGVGHSAYLMALADVAFSGGLDEKMLKDSKYIRPEFILGSGAPEYARNWLLESLNTYHPKKTGDWLKGNATTLLQLVGPNSDADDHQVLADALNRIGSFSAPEDREAVLRFVSAAKAQLVVLKGMLLFGSDSLYSGRESEVALALALIKDGVVTKPEEALAYVAEVGPGDANKALAKQLMGG